MNHYPLIAGSVKDCNEFFKVATTHPQVSVIDIDSSILRKYSSIQTELFGVMLINNSCNEYPYGRKTCDFSVATVSFLSPGKELPIFYSNECCCHSKCGKLLLFNESLFSKDVFDKMLYDDYHFFEYYSKEALHISYGQKRVLDNCFTQISQESSKPIDCYSSRIISKYIEILLDNCLRFYNCQFILRQDSISSQVDLLEKYIENYIKFGNIKKFGILDERNIAKEFDMSPSYFSDMLINSIGVNFKQYIDKKRIEIAKKMIESGASDNKMIADILGLNMSCYLKLFRLITGKSPDEYRSLLN